MIGTGDNPFGAAQGAVIPNSTLPAIVADLGRLLEREKRELQAGRYDQLAGFAAEKHHLLAQMSQAVQRNGGGRKRGQYIFEIGRKAGIAFGCNGNIAMTTQCRLQITHYNQCLVWLTRPCGNMRCTVVGAKEEELTRSSAECGVARLDIDTTSHWHQQR